MCVELTIIKNNIFLLAFSNETNLIYLFHIGQHGEKYSTLQPRSCPSVTEGRFILFSSALYVLRLFIFLNQCHFYYSTSFFIKTVGNF